jgi:CheY-like chemotaxis protein
MSRVNLFAGGGTGLGLYITRAIVEKHDGSVGFESEGLGHGCNFFFNIPVFRLVDSPPPSEDTGVAPALAADPVPPASPLVGRTILICDDSDMTRKMLKKMLLGMGCKHCYEAKNGLEAVQITEALLQEAGACSDGGDEASAGAAVFDFILMDDHMPVLEGPAATRRIRALGFTNPIIGVTGNLASEDACNFTACGADSVLSKPLDMKKLTHVLAVSS